MYALPTRITPELISDYVAGRLDAPDAATIECIMRKHESIASAVAAARQLNARMSRYFMQRGRPRRHQAR